MKKIIIRLASILFGIFFALLLIEFSLRLFGSERTSYTQPDEILGLSYTPNAIYKFNPPEGCAGWGSEGRINSKGLRDYEYNYQKTSGTFRILALGDSFTEGMQHPLEVTWTKLLEKQLNDRGDGIHYEVINAGLGGIGTSKEYLFFTHEGYRFSPDMVILLFYRNDIEENSKELRSRADIGPFFIVDNGQLVLDDSFNKSFIFKLKSLIQTIRSKSYVVSLVTRVLFAQVRRPEAVKEEEKSMYVSASGQAKLPEQIKVEVDKAMEVTQRLLVELDYVVHNNGARLVVFNIDDISIAGSDQPNKLLTEVTKSQGIPYYDLSPDFDKYRQSTGEYIFGCAENNGEGHWSQAGHAQAAKLMFEFLLSQLLLPKK